MCPAGNFFGTQIVRYDVSISSGVILVESKYKHNSYKLYLIFVHLPDNIIFVSSIIWKLDLKLKICFYISLALKLTT